MKAYQFSKQGKSHVALGIECQDYHQCMVNESGTMALVGMADGVGSCPHSRKGAETAVKSALHFCRKHLPAEANADDILALLRMAMVVAQKAVKRRAVKEGNTPFDYSTTLMLVFGFQNHYYYGFSGDGGIVALKDGAFQEVTAPKKDGDCVLTLLNSSADWSFGTVDEAEGLLIATDGVRDKLVNKKVCLDREQSVYSNLCRALFYAADPEQQEEAFRRAFEGDCSLLYENLHRYLAERFPQEGEEVFERCKKNGYLEILMKSVHDDISLVVLQGDQSEEKADLNHYRERTIAEVLEEINRRLYPHRFPQPKEEPKEEEKDTVSAEGEEQHPAKEGVSHGNGEGESSKEAEEEQRIPFPTGEEADPPFPTEKAGNEPLLFRFTPRQTEEEVRYKLFYAPVPPRRREVRFYRRMQVDLDSLVALMRKRKEDKKYGSEEKPADQGV